MSKLKGIFSLPIHKICANDNLRPSLNYVHFVDGYAYATDAHVAVKIKLKSITTLLGEQELSLLNGYSANPETYAFLMGCTNIEPKENGIVNFTKKSISGTINLQKYESVGSWGNNKHNYVHEQLNSIFDSAFKKNKEGDKHSTFAINPYFLTRLSEALFKDDYVPNIRIRVSKANQAILVDNEAHNNKDSGVERIGLIMPIITNDNFSQ